AKVGRLPSKLKRSSCALLAKSNRPVALRAVRISLFVIRTGVAIDGSACLTPVRANCVTIATLVAPWQTQHPSVRKTVTVHNFIQLLIASLDLPSPLSVFFVF